MGRLRFPSVALQLLAEFPDADLLGLYALDRADDAFAQLVARYSRRSNRVTAPALGVAWSGITGWKVPVVKSWTDEAAALRRSIDLGVNTISGRRGRS